SLLASILILMSLLMMFGHKVVTFGLVPLDKSSEVLEERARDIIRKAGYQSPSIDSTHGFQFENETVDYIARTDPRLERWQDLKDGQPAVLVYWYRESPTYLANLDLVLNSWNSPPPTRSGMTGVRLDTRGRLLDFYAVPPQVDPVPAGTVSSSESRVSSSKTEAELETQDSKLETDWSILFDAAGLRLANFKPVASEWLPLHT